MTCVKCHHATVKKFGRYGRLRIQRYRCTSCSATFSDPAPASSLGTMRISEETGLKAIQCLLEGCSVRSTERLTDLHRDTILNLLVLAGDRCSRLMDARMRGLQCKFVQVDEIWSFVMKKQRRVRSDDPAEFGDQWVFCAIDADTKLVPCFTVGKRTRDTTEILINNLAQRLANRVQITTDGFRFYIGAIEREFGSERGLRAAR